MAGSPVSRPPIEETAFRDPSEELWWMDEFFVMRKYRRKGVGEIVAREVFDRLPGTWEVGQIAPNEVARKFLAVRYRPIHRR